MESNLTHEIELYSAENFRTLLDHEINRSRRYGEPLTLVHLVVETDSDDPRAQHSAEMFAINALNLHLRDTDIPHERGAEFIVLMPATDEQAGRLVCERLEGLFNVDPQTYDRVSFKLSAFIGMSTLPGERSISSKMLLQNAAHAMHHARDQRLTKTVVFSEMKQ